MKDRKSTGIRAAALAMVFVMSACSMPFGASQEDDRPSRFEIEEGRNRDRERSEDSKEETGEEVSEAVLSGKEATITVCPDSEIIRENTYMEYWDEEAEQNPGIVFMTDYAVTDFSILSLELSENASDDPKGLLFHATTRTSFPMLSPEIPLVTGMVFYGTIPNNAISYVDGTGTKRAFAVDISGYDGSFELTELTYGDTEDTLLYVYGSDDDVQPPLYDETVNDPWIGYMDDYKDVLMDICTLCESNGETEVDSPISTGTCSPLSISIK